MRALQLLLLAVAPLAAADLSGIWVGKVPARNGEMQDIAFQFRHSGTKLEGKLYGDYQSSPIVRGTVAGAAVTFVVSASEQSGNQINESRIRFTGRWYENGEIELTRERESSHNAGNSGAAEEKRVAPRLTFRLKRLT
jgi:hypothetical protein